MAGGIGLLKVGVCGVLAVGLAGLAEVQGALAAETCRIMVRTSENVDAYVRGLPSGVDGDSWKQQVGEWNSLGDDYAIRVGQSLRVPSCPLRDADCSCEFEPEPAALGSPDGEISEEFVPDVDPEDSKTLQDGKPERGAGRSEKADQSTSSEEKKIQDQERSWPRIALIGIASALLIALLGLIVFYILAAKRRFARLEERLDAHARKLEPLTQDVSDINEQLVAMRGKIGGLFGKVSAVGHSRHTPIQPTPASPQGATPVMDSRRATGQPRAGSSQFGSSVPADNEPPASGAAVDRRDPAVPPQPSNVGTVAELKERLGSALQSYKFDSIGKLLVRAEGEQAKYLIAENDRGTIVVPSRPRVEYLIEVKAWALVFDASGGEYGVVHVVKQPVLSRIQGGFEVKAKGMLEIRADDANSG